MSNRTDDRKNLYGIGGIISSTYEAMSDSLHGFISRDPYDDLKDYAGNQYYPTFKGRLDRNRYGANNVFYPDGDATRPIHLHSNDGLLSPLRSDPSYLSYQDWERSQRGTNIVYDSAANTFNALGFAVGAGVGIGVAAVINAKTTNTPWMQKSMESHLGEPGEHVHSVKRGAIAGRVMVPMLAGTIMGSTYGGVEGAMLGAVLGNTLGYISTKVSPFESLIEQADRSLGRTSYKIGLNIRGTGGWKPIVSSYFTPALFMGVAIASLTNKMQEGATTEYEYRQGRVDQLTNDIPENLMYESTDLYRGSPKALNYKTKSIDSGLHPMALWYPNSANPESQAWRFNPDYKKQLAKLGIQKPEVVDYVKQSKEKLRAVTFVSSANETYSGVGKDVTMLDRLPPLLTSMAITGIAGGLMSVGSSLLKYRNSEVAKSSDFSGFLYRLLKNSETYTDKIEASATHSKAGNQLIKTVWEFAQGKGKLSSIGKSSSGVAQHLLADLKTNFKQYASLAGIVSLVAYGALTGYQNSRTVELATKEQGYKQSKKPKGYALELPIHPDTLALIDKGELTNEAKQKFNESLMEKIGRSASFTLEDGSSGTLYDAAGGSKALMQWLSAQKDSSVRGSFYSPDPDAKLAKLLSRVSTPNGGIAFSFGFETNNVIGGLFGQHFTDGAIGEVFGGVFSTLATSNRRAPEFGNLVNKITGHLFGVKAYRYETDTDEPIKTEVANPLAGKNLLGVGANVLAYAALGAVVTSTAASKLLFKGNRKWSMLAGAAIGAAYGLWQPTTMSDQGRQATGTALEHLSGSVMSIPLGYGVLGKNNPYYNAAYGAAFTGVVLGTAAATVVGSARNNILASRLPNFVKNLARPSLAFAVGIAAGAVIGIQRPSSYLQGLGWNWESNLGATYINESQDLPGKQSDKSRIHHAKMATSVVNRDSWNMTGNIQTLKEQAEGKGYQLNVLLHIKDSKVRHNERLVALQWLNSKDTKGDAPNLQNFILGGYGGNSEAKLLKEIYSAKGSIELTGPYMTSEPVFQALKAMAKKGVQVTVNVQNPFAAKGGGDTATTSKRLLDLKTFAEKNHLNNIVINITREDADLLAHLKTVVIDGSKSFLMSHNISNASNTTTKEIIEILKGKDAAKFFTDLMKDFKYKGQLVPLYDKSAKSGVLDLLSKTAYPSILRFKPNKYESGLLSNLYRPDFSLKFDDGSSQQSNRLGTNGISGIIYLPTSLPDSYYKNVRRSRPRLYTDYQQAMTSGEDPGWFKNAILASADRQLHPEGLTEGIGASINEFFNQDIYKEGQGAVGTLIKGIGRLLDTATGYYAMKQMFDRQTGHSTKDDILNAHKGQYGVKEDRGFFETFLSTTTKTIASAGTALVFYFGFSHAVSLVNAHIEDLGLAHIVNNIVNSVQSPDTLKSAKLATRFLSGQQSVIAIGSAIATKVDPTIAVRVASNSRYISNLFDYIGLKAVSNLDQEAGLLGETGLKQLMNTVEGLSDITDVTASGVVNLKQEIQDALNKQHVTQYLVGGSAKADIDTLVEKVQANIKSKGILPSQTADVQPLISDAIKEVIGYDKTTGELDLQRTLIGDKSLGDQGAFSWLGRIRSIDKSNFVNVVRPVLESISVLADVSQAQQFYGALDNLAKYAGEAPNLRLFEGTTAIYPKITNYGTERLKEIAKQLDIVARYIPANPLYYIPGVRTAFGIKDLKPGDTNDMSLKGFIGPGFEGLIQIQGDIARNISRINKQGFTRHWQETRWLFGVNELLSRENLPINESNLEESIKQYSKIQRRYSAAIKLNYVNPLSNLEPVSAYSKARGILGVAASVLVFDKLLDMYAMQNSGVDAPTSILLDYASRDKEGNKLFQSEYSSTLPVSLRLPIAVAGGAVGGRLFYTIATSKTREGLVLSTPANLAAYAKDNSFTPTLKKAIRELEEGLASRTTMHSSKFGMFLGAAAALIASQVATGFVSWAANTLFRKPFATEGLQADERVIGAVRIAKSISTYVYKKTNGGTEDINKSLNLQDKLNLFMASNAIDKLLHSKTEGYKPQYTFATQIPNPIFQLAIVSKLDPSGQSFALGAGFQFLPLMGAGSIPPFPITFITRPSVDIKDVLKDEYMKKKLNEDWNPLKSLLYGLTSFFTPQFMSLDTQSGFSSALMLAGATSFTRTVFNKIGKYQTSNATIQRELKSAGTFIKAASVAIDSAEKVVRWSQVPTVILPHTLYRAASAFLFPFQEHGVGSSKWGKRGRAFMPYFLAWLGASAAMSKGSYAEAMGTEYEAAGFVGDGNYQDALIRAKTYKMFTAFATAGYIGGALHYSGAFDAARDLQEKRTLFNAARGRMHAVYENDTLLPRLRIHRLDAFEALKKEGNTIDGFAKVLGQLEDHSDQNLLELWKVNRANLSDPLVKELSRLHPPLIKTAGLRIALAGEALLTTVGVMSLIGIGWGAVGLGMREEGNIFQAAFTGALSGPFRLVAGMDPRPHLSGKAADKWAQVARYRKQILQARMGRAGGMPNQGDWSHSIGQIGNLLSIPWKATQDVLGITAPYKDDPKAFLNIFGPIGASEGSKGWTFYTQTQQTATDLSTSKYYMDTTNMDISESLALRVLMQGREPDLNQVVNLLTAQPAKLQATKLRNPLNQSESSAVMSTSPELMMALNARGNAISWLTWQRGEELGISFYRMMAATGRLQMKVGGVQLTTDWKQWNPYDSLRATILPTFDRFDIPSSLSAYEKMKSVFAAGNRWLATGSINAPDLDSIEILSNYRTQQGQSIPVVSQLQELFSLSFNSLKNDQTKKVMPTWSMLSGVTLFGLTTLLAAATVTSLGFAGITAVSALAAYKEGGDKALLTEELIEKSGQLKSKSYAFKVKDGKIALASTRANAPGGQLSGIDANRLAIMSGVQANSINLNDVTTNLTNTRNAIHTDLINLGTLEHNTAFVDEIINFKVDSGKSATDLADRLTSKVSDYLSSRYSMGVNVGGSKTVPYYEFMGLKEEGLQQFLEDSTLASSPMQTLKEDIIKILHTEATPQNKLLRIQNTIAGTTLDISRKMDVGFGDTDFTLLSAKPKKDYVVDPIEARRVKLSLSAQVIDHNATYMGSMVERYGLATTTGYAFKGLISLAQPVLDISQMWYPLFSMGTELGSNNETTRRQAASAFAGTAVEQGLGLIALKAGLQTLMTNPALLIGTTAILTGLYLADKSWNKGKGSRAALGLVQKLDAPLEGTKRFIRDSVYTISAPTPVKGVLNILGLPFRALDPVFTSIHRNTQNTGWGNVAFWMLPQTTESRMFTTAEEFKGKSTIWGDRLYEMSAQEVEQMWKQKERRMMIQSTSIQANLDYDLVAPQLQGSTSSAYDRIYYDKYFDNIGYVDRVLANFAPSSTISTSLRLAAVARQRAASSSAGGHWLGGAAYVDAGQSTNIASLVIINASRVGHAHSQQLVESTSNIQRLRELRRYTRGADTSILSIERKARLDKLLSGKIGALESTISRSMLVEEIFSYLADARQKGVSLFTYVGLEKSRTAEQLRNSRMLNPIFSRLESLKSNKALSAAAEKSYKALSSNLGIAAMSGVATTAFAGYAFGDKPGEYNAPPALGAGAIVAGTVFAARTANIWTPKTATYLIDNYEKSTWLRKVDRPAMSFLLGAGITYLSFSYITEAFRDPDKNNEVSLTGQVVRGTAVVAGGGASVFAAYQWIKPTRFENPEQAIDAYSKLKNTTPIFSKVVRGIGKGLAGFGQGVAIGYIPGMLAGAAVSAAYPENTRDKQILSGLTQFFVNASITALWTARYVRIKDKTTFQIFIDDLSAVSNVFKGFADAMTSLGSKFKKAAGEDALYVLENSGIPEAVQRRIKIAAIINVGTPIKATAKSALSIGRRIAPALIDLAFIAAATNQVRSLDGRSLRSEWIEASKNFLNTSVNIVVGAVLAKAGLGRVLSTTLLYQNSLDVYGRNLGNTLADQSSTGDNTGRNIVYGSAALLTLGSFAGVLGRNKLAVITNAGKEAAPFVNLLSIPFDLASKMQIGNQIKSTSTGRERNYELSAKTTINSLFTMPFTPAVIGGTVSSLFHPVTSVAMGVGGVLKSAGLMSDDEPKRLLKAGIVSKSNLKELATYKNTGSMTGSSVGALAGLALALKQTKGMSMKIRAIAVAGYMAFGYGHGGAAGSDLGRNIYIAKESDEENWMNVAGHAVWDFLWPVLVSRPVIDRVVKRYKKWTDGLDKYEASKLPKNPPGGLDGGVTLASPATPSVANIEVGVAPAPTVIEQVINTADTQSTVNSNVKSATTAPVPTVQSITRAGPTFSSDLFNALHNELPLRQSPIDEFKRLSNEDQGFFRFRRDPNARATTFELGIKAFQSYVSEFFRSLFRSKAKPQRSTRPSKSAVYVTTYGPSDLQVTPTSKGVIYVTPEVIDLFPSKPTKKARRVPRGVLSVTYTEAEFNAINPEYQRPASLDLDSSSVAKPIYRYFTSEQYDSFVANGSIRDILQERYGDSVVPEGNSYKVLNNNTRHINRYLYREVPVVESIAPKAQSYIKVNYTEEDFIDKTPVDKLAEMAERRYSQLKTSKVNYVTAPHPNIDRLSGYKDSGFIRLDKFNSAPRNMFELTTRAIRTSIADSTAGARRVVAAGAKGTIRGGIAELGFVPNETGRIGFSGKALRSAQFTPTAIGLQVFSTGLQVFEDVFIKELPMPQVVMNAGFTLASGVAFGVGVGAAIQGIAATGAAMTAAGVAGGGVLTVGAAVAAPLLLAAGGVLLFNQAEQVETAYRKKNKIQGKAYTTQVREAATVSAGIVREPATVSAGIGLAIQFGNNPLQGLVQVAPFATSYLTKQYKKHQQELAQLKAKTKQKQSNAKQFQDEAEKYNSKVDTPNFFLWLLSRTMNAFNRLGDASRKYIQGAQQYVQQGIYNGVQSMLDKMYGPFNQKVRSNIAASDKTLLIQLALAEAEGEGIAGQAAVIRSVLNRKALIDSGRASASSYSSKSGSVFDIVYAYNSSNGVFQYSPVGDGRINKKFTAAQYAQAERAYDIALSAKSMSKLGISSTVISSPNFQNAGLGKGSFWKGSVSVLNRHAYGQDVYSAGKDLRQLFDQQFGIQEPIDLSNFLPSVGKPTNLNAGLSLPESSEFGSRSVSLPGQGTVTITEGFFDNDTAHSSKSPGLRAIYANDPTRVVIHGRGNYNIGLDYVVGGNGSVRSLTGGRVIAAESSSKGYGNRVVIETDLLYNYAGQRRRLYTHYAHLSSIRVKQGQSLNQGQGVGVMGNTGGSKGAHVDNTFWFLDAQNNKVYVSPNIIFGVQSSQYVSREALANQAQTSTSNLLNSTNQLLSQYSTQTTAVYKQTKGKIALWSIGGSNTGHHQLNANSTYSSLKHHHGGKKDYKTKFGWARDLQLFVNGSNIGSPIRAAQDSVVKYAGPSRNGKGQITGYGNVVELYTIDGKPLARNAHLLSIAVNSGQVVRAGDIIGYQGGTGAGGNKNAYPSHLHIEASEAYVNAFIKGTLTGQWYTTQMGDSRKTTNVPSAPTTNQRAVQPLYAPDPIRGKAQPNPLLQTSQSVKATNVQRTPNNDLVNQLNAIPMSALEPLKQLMYAGEGNQQSINVIRRDKQGNRITGYASTFMSEFGKSAENVTLGEIRARQRQVGKTKDQIIKGKLVKGKTEIGAVGYPQFIGNTLGKAMDSLGLSDSTKFDAKTQDLLFKWLIFVKRPEVGAYLTGKSNNLKEANQGLAREFASIGLAYPEAPYAELVKSNSKSIPADAKEKRNVGQSLYSGVAGNAASKTPTHTQSVLKEVRNKLSLISNKIVPTAYGNTKTSSSNTRSSNLSVEIESIRKEYGLHSIIVQPNSGGVVSSVDKSKSPVVQSASMGKLPVAMLVLLVNDSIKSGNSLDKLIKLDPRLEYDDGSYRESIRDLVVSTKNGISYTTIRKLTTSMLKDSNNTAANILIHDVLGGDKKATALAKSMYNDPYAEIGYYGPVTRSRMGGTSKAVAQTSSLFKAWISIRQGNSSYYSVANQALSSSGRYKLQGDTSSASKIGITSTVLGNVGSYTEGEILIFDYRQGAKGLNTPANQQRLSEAIGKIRRILQNKNKPQLHSYHDSDHSRRLVAEAPLVLREEHFQMLDKAKRQAQSEVAALLKTKEQKPIVNLTISKPALVDLDHNSSMSSANTDKAKVKQKDEPEVVAVKKFSNSLAIEFRQSEANAYTSAFNPYDVDDMDHRGEYSQRNGSSNA